MKRFMLILLCTALLCCGVSCNKDDGDSKSVGESAAASSKVDDGVIEGKVTIYRPDSELMYMETVEVDFKGDALDLVAAIVENGALKEGISADEYYIDGDVLYINMNKAYEEYVCAGSAAEYFGLAVLANTLIANYSDVGVKKVGITVEGRDFSVHDLQRLSQPF